MDDQALPRGTNARSYSAISPTAVMTAYGRSFSDLPFAREMYDALSTRLPLPDITPEKHFAVRWEARHRLVDRLLEEASAQQILEIAAGYSTHGMAYVLEHLDATYIEFDMDDVIAQKRAIVEELSPEAASRIVFEAGSALSPGDVMKATRSLHPHQGLAVVTEGLLPYFTFDEKTHCALTIKSLLARFHGCWITPDIILKSTFSRPVVVATNALEHANAETQSDLYNNAFDSVDHAREFFGGLGFDVRTVSYQDITSELTSLEVLGITRQKIDELNKDSVVLVMTT